MPLNATEALGMSIMVFVPGAIFLLLVFGKRVDRLRKTVEAMRRSVTSKPGDNLEDASVVYADNPANDQANMDNPNPSAGASANPNPNAYAGLSSGHGPI